MDPAHENLYRLLRVGVDAVEPGAAVRSVVDLRDGRLVVGPYEMAVDGRIQVMALGKAALAMTEGLAAATPGVSLYGVAVTTDGSSDIPGVVTLHGAHPMPDLGSLVAGRRLLATAALTPPEIPVVFLISGGGSAMAEAPLRGVTVHWIRETTEKLLRAGASIEDVNTIRRHVSALKGGGLAAAVSGDHVTIAISDVTGSPPHAIASGPTVADPSTREEAERIAERYEVDLPEIDQPIARPIESRFVVAADAGVAADAVVATGRAMGMAMELRTTRLDGEARDAALWAIDQTRPGTVGLFAGETTVTVMGNGVGGRNQEAALAASIAIEGSGIRFAALGTDGVDGPSPAAGAVVDGDTVEAGREIGLDAAAALADNDSYTYLDAVGATIVTGPSGTNVGDLWLVDRPEDS